MDPQSSTQESVVRRVLRAFKSGVAVFVSRRAQSDPRAPLPPGLAPADVATKLLHTSLGEVVYRETGSGPLLIFVHDFFPGASSYEWSKVYPLFASSHRVLAPDLIGCGESSRPLRHFNSQDYVRMLAELIRSLEWQRPPTIVASGLSGGLCVYLASEHPALVERLVLFRPTGGGRPSWPRRLVELVFRVPGLSRLVCRSLLSHRPSVARWLRGSCFSDAKQVTDELVEIFLACALQKGAEYPLSSRLAGRLNFDLPNYLRWCRCRVSILEGTVRLSALESPERMIASIHRALDDTHL
jgi:pimeloyl-ACP methyl ester carboxylesterase